MATPILTVSPGRYPIEIREIPDLVGSVAVTLSHQILAGASHAPLARDHESTIASLLYTHVKHSGSTSLSYTQDSFSLNTRKQKSYKN